jgi:hypothetical protein
VVVQVNVISFHLLASQKWWLVDWMSFNTTC